MNGLVAAPPQFCADRRFAGAGNALDEIISFAHKTIHYFAGGIGVNLLPGRYDLRVTERTADPWSQEQPDDRPRSRLLGLVSAARCAFPQKL
jgi:hypothetical protein